MNTRVRGCQLIRSDRRVTKLNFKAIYVQSCKVTCRDFMLLIIGDRTQEVTRIVV